MIYFYVLSRLIIRGKWIHYDRSVFIIMDHVRLIQILRKEKNKMAKPIKPGTDNQQPGTYKEVGPRGGDVSKPRIIHIDPGDRLPPTQKPGNKWEKQ